MHINTEILIIHLCLLLQLLSIGETMNIRLVRYGNGTSSYSDRKAQHENYVESSMLRFLIFQSNVKLDGVNHKHHAHLDLISCSHHHPRPRNEDESAKKLNFIHISSAPHKILVNSTIEFKCKQGYFIKRLNESIFYATITCLPNGTWTDVPDCEPHECFNETQIRDISIPNGHKFTELKLTSNGSIDYVQANFMCDKYFELVGSPSLACHGDTGVWNMTNSIMPICKLKRSQICTRMPPKHMKNADLKYHQGQKVKVDLGNGYFKYILVFTRAMYMCPKGLVFRDTRLTETFVQCTGDDMWEKVHRCIYPY